MFFLSSCSLGLGLRLCSMMVELHHNYVVIDRLSHSDSPFCSIKVLMYNGHEKNYHDGNTFAISMLHPHPHGVGHAHSDNVANFKGLKSFYLDVFLWVASWLADSSLLFQLLTDCIFFTIFSLFLLSRFLQPLARLSLLMRSSFSSVWSLSVRPSSFCLSL